MTTKNNKPILSSMSENTNSNDNKENNQELGALWKKESKNGGQKYLAGHVIVEDDMGVENKIKVVVFANREKKNDRYPDFRILKARNFSNPTPDTPKKEEVAQEVTQEADEDVL